MGQSLIYPVDSSPINYTGFTGMQPGQDVYIAGGNSNVTIATGSGISWLTTCSGQNINLVPSPGFCISAAVVTGTVPNSASEICTSGILQHSGL